MISTLGIDVSKEWLDICLWPQRTITRHTNTPEGIGALVQELSAHPVEHIVLEPSGGYEKSALQSLQEHGLPVSRVNARQIRDYARATGRLAKTDKLDALVLAEYGSVLKPPVTRKAPEQQRLLQDCSRRREQIICLIRQEKHALEHLHEPQLAEMTRHHLAFLEEQLCRIDERVRTVVASDTDMSRRYKILTSCKGIGFVTAITLIADMPELGAIDHRKAAALAGLAPLNHDSGQYRGQRHIAGGRKNVRQALYMAALSASLFNPSIKAFKLKLKNKGKSGKCSNIACARKLLVTLNALLTENRLWHE